MPAELEIKLNIEAQALKKLLKTPLVADKIIAGSSKTQHLVTAYYDTASLALMKNGVAYRVRKNGGQYEATIKTEENSMGGFSSRNEYNVQLPNARPTLKGFKEAGFGEDLAALLNGEKLEKLFTVDVKRELYLLQVTDATVLELAVDRGKITAGAAKCSINETELEIKSGTKADLMAYTAQLAAAVPVSIEPRSKYERGMRLCGTDLSRALPEGKLKTNAKAPAREALTSLFYYYADQCLRLQNAMLAEAALLSEADVTVLPRLRSLQALLVLQKPLLQAEDYNAKCALLAGLLQPLQELHRVKLLAAQWQQLCGLGLLDLHKSKMDKRLTEQQKQLTEALTAQLTDGSYARVLFALLAWAETSHWQNDSVIMEELVAARLRDWHNELADLQLHGGVDAEEARKLLELTANIVYVRRSVSKAGRMCRSTWAQVKALHKSALLLQYGVYSGGSLHKKLAKGSSRSEYRDVGILLGWRLQLRQGAVKSVLKNYKALLDAMKDDE